MEKLTQLYGIKCVSVTNEEKGKETITHYRRSSNGSFRVVTTIDDMILHVGDNSPSHRDLYEIYDEDGNKIDYDTDEFPLVTERDVVEVIMNTDPNLVMYTNEIEYALIAPHKENSKLGYVYHGDEYTQIEDDIVYRTYDGTDLKLTGAVNGVEGELYDVFTSTGIGITFDEVPFIDADISVVTCVATGVSLSTAKLIESDIIEKIKIKHP